MKDKEIDLSGLDLIVTFSELLAESYDTCTLWQNTVQWDRRISISIELCN